MHGVGFRSHERPRACSYRRRCRHPLSALVAVSEGLELTNGCDTLLVDVDHDMGSQIFIQGAEATPAILAAERCRPSYPRSRSEFVCVTRLGDPGKTLVCMSSACGIRNLGPWTGGPEGD